MEPALSSVVMIDEITAWVSTLRVVRFTFGIMGCKGVKVDYICIHTFLKDMSSNRSL